MKSNIKTAEEEYEKDANLKREDIAHLKSWIEKQAHLPNVEDTQLIPFYHASDYSLQRTKELVEIHYTFRTDVPELYPTPEYVPPRCNYDMLDVIYTILCPKPSPQGYRIIYAGLKDTDPSKYNFEAALTAFVKLVNSITVEEGVCSGYLFVFDIAGIGVQHLATISISLVKKFFYFVQEAVSIKVKGVHVINVTSIIDKIMFLVKPFMKKELFDILYFYSDMDQLYVNIPKECLPCDLGGTQPSRNELAELSRQRLERCKEFMAEDYKKRTDESKRQNSRRNRMEGSFRKIEID